MASRIVVPLDRSPEAEAAIATAAAIARSRRAELHLVVVHPNRAVDVVPVPPDYRAYHDGPMQRLAMDLRGSSPLAVTTAILNGETVDALAGYASAQRADLIVMTTHGRTGWMRAWAGSTADELMHATRIPVLMVRQPSTGETAHVQRVLVAVESIDQGREAAITALDAFDGAGVVVVLGQVVAPVPASLEAHFPAALVLTDAEATQAIVAESELVLEEMARKLRIGRLATIETVVQVAPPVFPASPIFRAVVDLAIRERVDVVAMTTHERGWTRLLVGSVADHILSDTRCMLLTRHMGSPMDAAFSRTIHTVVAEVLV